MKTETLKSAISSIMPFLDDRGLVAEYACINFQDTFVQASNGKMLIRFNFSEPCGINCSVSAAAFAALVRSITAAEVFLTIADGKLKVKAGRVNAEFVLPQNVTYPELNFNPTTWYPVGQEYLKALFLARMTTCPDQTAGPLTGVHVMIDTAIPNKTRVIATDRYRISLLSVEAPFIHVPAYTLHIDFIDQVKRYASQVESVALQDNTVYAQLKDKRAILACKLLAGDYPSTALLGAENMALSATTAVKIPLTKPVRDAIVDAVKRQTIIQQNLLEFDRTTRVTIKPKLGLFVLYAQEASVGAVEEEVEIDTALLKDINEFNFLINPEFLTEAFSSVEWMSYIADNQLCCFGSVNFSHLIKAKYVEEELKK